MFIKLRCNNRPCGANGACFPVVSTVSSGLTPIETATYHCQCYSGFHGLQCERGSFYKMKIIFNKNLEKLIIELTFLVGALPCASNPCLNNGVCINQNNTWNYYCKNNFFNK